MKGKLYRLGAALLAALLLFAYGCSSPGVTAPVSSTEPVSSTVSSGTESTAPSSSHSGTVSSQPSSSAEPADSSLPSSSEESSAEPWTPAPVETPAATPTPPPVSSEVTSESSSEASSETSSETDSAVSAESSAPSSSEDPSSSEISSESSSVPESSSSAPSSSEESSAPEESRGEELSPIEQAVATATDKRHLQLSETPHTSEEAANRYFYDMVYSNYVDFGVFVTKPVFAHTAEEYAELFPGLDSITMTEAAVYSNGYYFRFHLSRNINFALKTALVSGNTAYLTETERLAYDNLWAVLDSCIQSDMSNTARVMAIHDHIVAHTTYGSSGNAYTAVGVLVDRKAVCDGYSKAFQLFMDALGIPCVRFTGTAGGVSHAWNAVQLNGCWYHVDVTWDDPVPDSYDRVSYEYFLVPDSIIAADHSWSYAPVSCTDDSLLLYPYSYCYGETMDELKSIFNEQEAVHSSLITLAYPTGLAADEDIVRAMGAASYYPSFTRGFFSVLVIRAN